MKIYVLFCFIAFNTICILQNSFSQSINNVYQVKSINPSDTNTDDLKFLDKILLNNEILFLGEKAHGEGNITLAKTRLIKYLNVKLGYNIIVFESGFYDACMMNKIIKMRKKPETIFWAAFQSILYNTKEFNKLKIFLINGIKNNSIKLCGIDNQLGAISYNTLITNISNKLKTANYTIDSISVGLINKYIWNKNGSKYGYFENSTDSVMLFHTLDSLVYFSENLNSEKDNLIAQSVKNLLTILKLNIKDYYDVPFYIRASERDAQMADNLLWIYRHKEPKDKIIVWTASMHSARNIFLIKEVSDTIFYKNYVTMGQIVHDSIGDKMYSLAFTASGGYYQTPYMMKDSVQIKSVENNSVESFFKNRSIKYGLVNFQNTDTTGYFWNELYSNPHGNSNVKAIWPKIHDGIFYIDTIHPPTLIKK